MLTLIVWLFWWRLFKWWPCKNAFSFHRSCLPSRRQGLGWTGADWGSSSNWCYSSFLNLRLVTEDWGCLVDKIPKTKSHWNKFSIRIAFLERKKLTNVCCCSSVPSFKYGIHSYLLKFHKLFFCSSTKFPLKLVKEFLCLINWKNTTGRDLRQSFLHLSHHS